MSLRVSVHAPPHEFGIDVPRTLAKIRIRSYEDYCWPGFLAAAFRRNNLLTGFGLAAGLIALMFAATLVVNGGHLPRPVGSGDFYAVVPHEVDDRPVRKCLSVRGRGARDRRATILAATWRGPPNRREASMPSSAGSGTFLPFGTCTAAERTARRPKRHARPGGAGSTTARSTAFCSVSPRRLWRRSITRCSAGWRHTRTPACPSSSGPLAVPGSLVGTAGLLLAATPA